MKLVIYSSALAGRDEEFNEWYDTVHLKEVLEIPGVTSGTRYRVRSAGRGPLPEHRYATVYEIDGDPEAVLAEIFARSRDGRFQLSDSIDAASTRMHFWEEP
ncbi:DUF4286 family protein [Prauserella endophytica]|uniref:DUF4286 family protein n=1 Tax=Prauserella endophytica TaxID=1592324 RepID=A0ABY2S4Z9_9PSEU|nr:DUF4286 family protein [Prauserella endophytica]PXY33318.1 hypothetical protein BAY59_09455 [Prauserella coralliicola]TKG70895.1 hypothetical protein FCN18_15360 [Prauserella endophytica]